MGWSFGAVLRVRPGVEFVDAHVGTAAERGMRGSFKWKEPDQLQHTKGCRTGLFHAKARRREESVLLRREPQQSTTLLGTQAGA